MLLAVGIISVPNEFYFQPVSSLLFETDVRKSYTLTAKAKATHEQRRSRRIFETFFLSTNHFLPVRSATLESSARKEDSDIPFSIGNRRYFAALNRRGQPRLAPFPFFLFLFIFLFFLQPLDSTPKQHLRRLSFLLLSTTIQLDEEASARTLLASCVQSSSSRGAFVLLLVRPFSFSSLSFR